MQATGATPSTHIVSPAISENPAPVPNTPMLPPIHGALPVAREDYEKWDESKKSPGLDFLILGKMPGSDRQQTVGAGSTEPTQTIPLEDVISDIVSECIQWGELDALEFFWRESGIDPETSVVAVSLVVPNATNMKALAEHCHAHPGLKVNLVTLTDLEPSVVADLTRLIGQGKVVSLATSVSQLSSSELSQLAESFGKLEALVLHTASFDIHSEKVFAESLLNSASLKKLTLNICDFGASGGVQFVEGMQKNQSITHLSMAFTPNATMAFKGYGAILAKNTALQSVEIMSDSRQPANIDSIIIGANSHPSLQSLKVMEPLSIQDIQYPVNLNRLLQNNHVLTRLDLSARLTELDQYKDLAAAFKTNVSITEFFWGDWEEIPADARKSMEDTLARNRALVDRSTLVKAGEAFDPDPLLRNGLSDAGSVIARYVLANSSSLEEFAHTMAGVELSMREAINQTLANSSSSATTTTTPTTTTGTTTTTTTTPPGSTSS